ncbi:hypothetical protein BHE74_00044629 [Ensete ventricosum]|nr:hypothetical protein BHE74_00044629 [Ensete ventricosum]
MQRYRKKKRQRSGSQLEATATAIRGRYWEGKERFVEDQIRQQKGSGYGGGGDYEREAVESSGHYGDGSSGRAMVEIATYFT